VQTWNSYWVYPEFRRVQYTITVVWAAALLLDAGVRVALTFVLPTASMVGLSPVIFYVGLFRHVDVDVLVHWPGPSSRSRRRC
jgi:hypothetical protein